MTTKIRHCWVIHDGASGNRRQAVALAETLGWSYDEKILDAKGLAKLFAPRIPPVTAHPFGRDFAVDMQNAPAYVIGCGRQAALATRLMKKAGSFAIQILDPKIASHHWDVVIAPTHDRMQGKNVITCIGSLHDVNEASLKHWRLKDTVLGNLEAPRTAVFIGGPSRMAKFNEGLIEVLFSQLEYDLAKQGGSLIICGSRRTPKLAADKIRQRFSDSNFPVWFDDGDGENLY